MLSQVGGKVWPPSFQTLPLGQGLIDRGRGVVGHPNLHTAFGCQVIPARVPEASGRGALIRRPRSVSEETLRVEVRGDEIIVTLPGSRYMVVYHKSGQSSRLLPRHIPQANDALSLMLKDEFLARASKLANDKARELGWIV